jgi:thiosulfate/3-mercaptopyruvate sulfurtransferase
MSTHDDALLRAKVLISAERLNELLKLGLDVVVLDVRPHADGENPASSYHAGHIPNAVYVSFPSELAAPGGGTRGRLPLPTIETLQRDARVWGINKTSIVVTYGDRGPAARAWWVLRWAGLQRVLILDGGLAAWSAAGFKTASIVPKPKVGNVVLSAGHLPVVNADEAASIARIGLLLDARGSVQYQGGPAKPGEAPTGHIPGAVSAPTDDNLAPDGKFVSTDALRARFEALGVGKRPIGVYCGGGVSATHEIAALQSIGFEAALFPGSWSAWSADPKRPVITGPSPG